MLVDLFKKITFSRFLFTFLLYTGVKIYNIPVINFFFTLAIYGGRFPRGVMVKALDCGIVVREFVLQSCYYVHFRANTLGKGMSPLILPAMG